MSIGSNPFQSPLLTTIKLIYSSFPMPWRKKEKGWAQANPLLIENQASLFHSLKISFEHTEISIR